MSKFCVLELGRMVLELGAIWDKGDAEMGKGGGGGGWRYLRKAMSEPEMAMRTMTAYHPNEIQLY